MKFHESVTEMQQISSTWSFESFKYDQKCLLQVWFVCSIFQFHMACITDRQIKADDADQHSLLNITEKTYHVNLDHMICYQQPCNGMSRIISIIYAKEKYKEFSIIIRSWDESDKLRRFEYEIKL